VGYYSDMQFFKKRQTSDVRPVRALSKHPTPPPDAPLLSTPFYKDAFDFFRNYPERSLMSDESRAVLFTLIRSRRPTYIAEIGTLHAGTTEVMARACWENSGGMIYTADPFGAERCPPIIAGWPKDLQKWVSFHPLSSMDFLMYLMMRRISLDMTLVDGNHDYEFALFDLQMVARLTRPGGIIVMDNAEQSGPFNAARTFLSQNPLWRELGNAIAGYNPSDPFNANRASLPDTTFIILEAPSHPAVGEGPYSWGQTETPSSRMSGLRFALPKQKTAGTLHYHVVFRAFFDDNAAPIEAKTIGRVRIDATDATTVEHAFGQPLQLPKSDKYTVEIDLSWQADASAPPLELTRLPEPMDD